MNPPRYAPSNERVAGRRGTDRCSVTALHKRTARVEDVGECATSDADFEHAAIERCFSRVTMLERKLLTAGADRDYWTND